MGHGSDSEGSGDDKKHSKHGKKDKHDKKDKHGKEDKHKGDKHDKEYKEDKHKGDKHDKHDKHESSGGHFADILPGHEKYTGKLKKDDVKDLKHRTDISDEEREHRRKVLVGEVAAGVVGAGALSFAGYEAYQHFSSKHEEDAHIQHKEA